MQTAEKNPLRSLSTTQWVVAGVALLVVIMVIIGTLVDAATPEPEFSLTPQQPFVALALLAFVGGVLSFLAPCTLPILPAYFAFASQSGRKQIALNTIVFMLGVATMFSLFGATASAVGSVLRQNQDLILLFGGAVVVVFGVMSLLGKGFGGIQQEEGQVQPRGLGGSYVFGITFAAGWSTCIGPILGIVLTMAATTGSVIRGTMLLFVYAIGLGLPLILVSTFIGRSSRKSWIWRLLRGKGWFVTVPTIAIAVLWALAAWRILVAAADYAFINFASLEGQSLSAFQEYGLLVLVLIAAGLWVFTSSGEKKTELQLHTTQLFSGVLFLAMGLLMLNGAFTEITALFSGQELLPGLYEIEESLFEAFQ